MDWQTDGQTDKKTFVIVELLSRLKINPSKYYQYEVICMNFFFIDTLIEVNGNQYFACISQSIQATILGKKKN